MMTNLQSSAFMARTTQLLSSVANLRLLLVMLLTLTVSANVWADFTPGTGYTLVTDISSLSTNDKVILFCNQNGDGVSGYNGTKDAIVSKTAADWIEYLVTKSTTSFTLKDGNKYIANPGGNEFKYGDSGGACTLDSDGLLICNSRNLMKNGSNYRFYATTQTYTNRFYVYKVAVSYAITAQSNNTTYGTVSLSGTTITATPNDGYRVKSGDAGYTVTSGTADVTNNGDNTFSVTPSSNCTITINFEAIPKYTVTLNAGPGTCAASVTEASAGAGVTLPTPTLSSACQSEGWSFAGWAEASVGTETEEAPSTLYEAGDTYKPTSNITLYAVYKRTEEGEGGGGGEPVEVSRTYTFSNYSAGTQYADNEAHELDDDVTLTTTDCHFTSELRIYASSTYNGYVVSNELPGRIISIGFNAGNNADNIAVFGSTDGTTWTEVGQVEVQSTYTDYTLEFGETNYTYFKLDVVGTKQIRLKSITITWESTSGGGNSSTTYYHSTPDCTTEMVVSLNPNGGTGNMADVTTQNGTLTLPKCTFTREGYTFAGWATSADGEVAFADEEVVSNWAANITELFAKWTAKALTNYRTFCDVVCDAYSFHTGSDADREEWLKEAIKCFVEAEGGFEHEWQIKDYIIPEDDKFFVGNYGYFYNDNLGIGNHNDEKSRSVVSDWGNMYLAPAMDENDAQGTPRLGHAKGAKGTLRIFEDSNWDNLFVGFIPDGYKLKFGDEEYTFAKTTGTEYRSEAVVEYNSTNADKNVSVGVVDADGKYVATNHTQEMRHIFLEVSKPLDGGSWADANAKFAIYYWNNSTNGWCGFLKNVPSETTLYEGWVPADATGFKFVRYNSNQSAPGSWDNDKAWNQTGDLTFQQVQENGNLFTITDWGTGTWSTYEKYGQFAMHDNSKSKNWYVHFVPHYVLTYDKNADDATGTMDIQTVAVDATDDDKKVVVANCEFTRPGYRFIKWRKGTTSTYYVPNGSNTIDLNADITLYAQWEKEYTVTYDANDGTTTCVDNNAYIKGETVTVCDKVPAKTGYTFDGWVRSDNGEKVKEGESFTMPANDVTLTAQWIINKYTVTLNPNYPDGKTGTFIDKDGNTISGNLVLTYDYNTASMSLTDLYQSIELEGYRFDGWYNAKGASDGTVSGSKWLETGKITRDLPFFAQWTEVDCRWIETDIANILPEDEVVVTMKIINSNGEISYQALGTETITNSPKSQGVKVTSGVINPADNLDFEFSKYSWSISTVTGGYTLQPYGMSGTYLYGMPSYISIGNNTEKNVFLIYASPENGNKCFAYVRDNAYYVGYGTEDGQGAWKRFTSYQSVLNNQTLKFYKRVCVDESNPWYTVTFDDGSGSCDTESLTGTEDEGITLPTATPPAACATDGWKFAGWWTEAVIETATSPGELLTAGSNYKPTSDCPLYAVYSKEETDEGGDTTPTKATLSFESTAQRTSFSTTQQVWEQNGITLTNNKAFSNSPVADYANPARFYAGSEIIIEAPGEIILIEADCSEAKYATALVNSITVDQTTADEVNITITPSESSNTYTIASLTNQTRFNSLTVTYLGTGGGPTTTYNSNPDCATYTLIFNDRGVETSDEYSAGYQVPQPADPTDVCTEPIEYVFDGWATAEITAENVTSYEKVTFPFTMPAESTTLYAVYRYVEEGSGDSGDYVKVIEDLDDYSGDYLIVYEAGGLAFDGGRNNVDDELDATSNTIEVTIDNNTIASNATTDAAKFTIAKVDGGYSIQSASGYFIGWSTAGKNGLNANSKYSANYYLNTISNSIISGVKGTLKYNKTSGQERFRYYQSGQEAIALYRKAASYLYTTSPVCGPHLVITEGKEIYVTGGNAQAARDLVMAQQKVSYKATRLNTKDGSAGGTAPDVVVANNGITKNGIVTSEVKVTFENTVKEQQADDTYTITGDIVVTYEADANNMQEDIQVQLAVDYPANADARDNFIVHARSLPSEFVIVAKSGDKWYALNADMSGSKAQPANGQVTLNDPNNPTEATYAPCNAIYTFEAMPQGAEDRKSVRFIGMENKYLWAASEGNNGVQNYSKAPAADALAYNWKLYTEDNITYHFGNAQNTRMLGLHSTNVAFGMYANGASVVQDIRILPYVEKCLYNYAPSNLKVSVLKGTYVTLTWDAVVGATKYQYSTNGTTWTDAGTEPTVTINDLSGDTEYTYYIRAYHEDAGVSQECIDYAEITFTTANCDDVPTDITYSADMNSIIVSWIANAATSIVNLYSDEEAEVLVATQSVASPCTFTDLAKNTQYYVQILANGTCASPIIPVKTEDVEVDIVEWDPQGIIVDINTDDTIGVTLENEVSYGSGLGSLAEDLFFSKYFEGSGSLKMIAIYNGTGKDVDLSEYRIDRGSNGDATNISKTYDLSQLGIIKQGQEIIFYSWPLTSEYSYSCSQSFLDSKVQESGLDANPRWILCDAKTHNGIEFEAMDFSGNDPLLLYKSSELIDVFGVSTEQESPASTQICSGRSDQAWSADGVTNMDYGKTTEDFPNGEIPHGVNVDDETITAYTARVIMFRKNTVVSGKNAVTKNTTTFATFAEEWEARQVCMSGDDGDLTCAAYQELGTFDYSDYYTKYESMGEGSTFDENDRNDDGTVTIPIEDLYKHACSNIRVKLTNSNSEVLSDREYKVPIMITTTQGTDGQAFLALQENLATVEVDGEGNPTGNKTNLTLEQVREICKTCDVVVRDNATLTKVTDGTENDHPQVHDVIVYEGASIVIPDGTDHNYTINSLALRRKGDTVASAQVQGTGKFVLPADAPVTLSMRIDAKNWHWFTLPYNCDIAKVTWSDGTPAKYNTDWFLMYYDGKSRAASTNPYDNHWKVYSGTTIEAGKGYIIGITGNLAHPKYTFELCFPMEQNVLTAEQTNKTVDLYAWGMESGNTPNNLGWNLVGNPYLNYYQPETTGFAGLSLLKYTGIDPVTGDRLYDDSGTVPFLVTPIDGGWYEYKQDLASKVQMMPFTAYFVQVGDPATHENGEALDASFTPENRAPKSLQARRNASEENNDPAIVAISLTNAKGESDKTTLLIADRFTNEYEMNADFFKWFGDYYRRYTKPVLYSMGADQGKRAFNALNEELAAQPVALGMFAAQAGDYTFSLTRKRCDLSRVEEVWLYDATTATYTNLMQQDYTFTTAKTEGEGRFYLSVKMKQKTPTAVENVNGNLSLVAHQQTLVLSGLPAEAQVWVYDATGKLLHSEHTTAYQRIYPVQQAGVYFVSVKGQGDAQTLSTIVK